MSRTKGQRGKRYHLMTSSYKECDPLAAREDHLSASIVAFDTEIIRILCYKYIGRETYQEYDRLYNIYVYSAMPLYIHGQRFSKYPQIPHTSHGRARHGVSMVSSKSEPQVLHLPHYCDVIMGAVASQITSLTIVYSTVYSDADQRKHQSSASLAFVRRNHRRPVNSPHKWPVTQKMFPFDDVILKRMVVGDAGGIAPWSHPYIYISVY